MGCRLGETLLRRLIVPVMAAVFWPVGTDIKVMYLSTGDPVVNCLHLALANIRGFATAKSSSAYSVPTPGPSSPPSVSPGFGFSPGFGPSPGAGLSFANTAFSGASYINKHTP